MTLLLIFLGLGLGQSTPALAQTLPPVVYSTTTATDIIIAYAVKYGIPAQPLIDTLRCESDFNANAIGDHGTSFGAAQIHLSAHPEITKAEAMDPLWSINWTAEQFAAGHADLWTCYRELDS